jgi:hypothetical protein
MAQTTWKAGFLLAAEGPLGADLDTGKGRWQARDLSPAVELLPPGIPGYHVIGPAFGFDMETWSRAGNAPVKRVREPLRESTSGIVSPGWILAPAELPEQDRRPWAGGRIRALRRADNPAAVWKAEDEGHPDLSRWQRLLDGGGAVEVPPGTELEILWDFETYLCGYPFLEVSGGNTCTVAFSWAESLFEAPDSRQITASTPKGRRDQVAGKAWLGLTDSWRLDGRSGVSLPALWWRSGRYACIRLRAAEEALKVNRLAILTTGYPLGFEASWESPDGEWDRLIGLMQRALAVNAHETWTDCPYYEQLNYLGDTVLHALSNYVSCADDRLTRATIRNFDLSRRGSGWVAERYPSRWRQESPTYAMLFPCLVRDYLMWRGGLDTVRERLTGVRSVIEEVLSIRAGNGLLGRVHGWPFVDWATDWNGGCGPGVREGDSSIVNLHAVRALEAAARIEDSVGESLMAGRFRSLAQEWMELIFARYWDPRRQLLADTSDKDRFSEHAQALALVSESLPEAFREGCLDGLKDPDGLSRATCYFSFYVLEAFWRNGCSDAFHQRLAWWRTLPDLGFTALPEAPEPSRSDAHGWAAHPYFHTFASIAGIRPLVPGMEQIQVAPLPGQWKQFTASCVHPRGTVRVSYRREKDQAEFRIQAPPGVVGELVYNGARHPLSGPGGTWKICV